jgi:hypothetical protein
LEVPHKNLKLSILALALAQMKQFLEYIEPQLTFLWESAIVPGNTTTEMTKLFSNEFDRKAASLVLLLYHYKPFITIDPIFSKHVVRYAGKEGAIIELEFPALYQMLFNRLYDWLQLTERYSYFSDEIGNFKYITALVLNTFYIVFQENKVAPYDELEELRRASVEQLGEIIRLRVKRRFFERNERLA